LKIIEQVCGWVFESRNVLPVMVTLHREGFFRNIS
jgi:hypothetical protein